MEAAITAPVPGVVQRLAIPSVQQVEGGDLLLVIATRRLAPLRGTYVHLGCPPFA